MAVTNPRFEAFIDEARKIHYAKSHDYADTAKQNFYSNFEEVAAATGLRVDDVFRVMIGIKLARLKELLQSGKSPQHESVADSKKDLAIYAMLWASYDMVPSERTATNAELAAAAETSSAMLEEIRRATAARRKAEVEEQYKTPAPQTSSDLIRELRERLGPPKPLTIRVDDGQTLKWFQDPVTSGFADVVSTGAIHPDEPRSK